MKYIYLVKHGNTLEPAFPDDMAQINKYKDGEVVRANINRVHSPQQHKAVFAVARTTLMNAPEDDSLLGEWGKLYAINRETTPYNFVKMCMVELGYYDILPTVNNYLIIPRSLQYDEMDREDFNMFFDSYLDICAGLLKVDKKTLLKNYPREA